MDRHQWDEWAGANASALLATVEAVREGIAHAAAHRVQAAPDSAAPSPDAGLEDRVAELAQLHADLDAARNELARAAEVTAHDTEPTGQIPALRGKIRELSERIAPLARTIPGPTASWLGGWVLERVGADSTHRQVLTPRDFDERDRRAAWPTPGEAAAAVTQRSVRRLPLRVCWTAAAAPAAAALAS